jgi:hypothetical protein
MYDYAFIRFNTGRKQPYGHFYKELSHDIQKVKDLAISGICDLGSKGPLMKDFEIFVIANSFGNLERVTLADAQHTPDCTAILGFADRSPYLSAQVQDLDYKGLMDYREWIFYWLYSNIESIYDGLDLYLWFEFGTLIERGNRFSIWSLQQDCITSTTRPIKIRNILATEEDCQRARPHTWVVPDFLLARLVREGVVI